MTKSAEPSTPSGSSETQQRRRQITSYKNTTTSPATDTDHRRYPRHSLATWGQNTAIGVGPAVTAAPAVPELSSWAMMLLGFAGIGFAAFRRMSMTGRKRRGNWTSVGV